jgi:hypothetical protein
VNTSERTGELIQALIKARSQFQPIAKTKHVTVTTKAGRRYAFDYAPLDVVQAATEPALSAEGLVLVSGVVPAADGTVELVTRLLHTSEQFMESRIPSGALEDVKALGGFVSHARRYNHLALLDLAGEDDTDGAQATGDHVEPTTKAAPASTNGHTPATAAVASSNGHTPPPPTEPQDRPTEKHIAALQTLALETCGEDPEVFATRIRQVMGLKPSASTSARLLTRTQTMAQYMVRFEYYTKLESQLARKTITEVSHGTPPAHTPASEPASTATVAAPTEGHPADPSTAASSSAPDAGPADAAERDRVRLRAEVAAWQLRISAQEIEHVILHNPYSKARALLWKTRVDARAATPIEAAAD